MRCPCQSDSANSTLAPFNSDLVASPEYLSRAPLLTDVVPRDDLQYIEDSHERMRMPEDEYSPDFVFANPHIDPSLLTIEESWFVLRER